jgi:hypothetical protein
MIEIPTDFPFLGARDYVHGTSLLSGFLDALESQGARGIRVKRLKFLRPARANGVFRLTRGAAPEPARATCSLKADADGAEWLGWFVEGDAPVTRREAVTYPIANVRAERFAGSCDIHPRNRDDLIRCVVEANKRFHEAGAGPGRVRVRFGYLEDWNAPGRDVSFRGRLAAGNLITRQSDGGWLTVNRMQYGPADGPATTLLLCFNADAESEGNAP